VKFTGNAYGDNVSYISALYKCTCCYYYYYTNDEIKIDDKGKLTDS